MTKAEKATATRLRNKVLRDAAEKRRQEQARAIEDAATAICLDRTSTAEQKLDAMRILAKIRPNVSNSGGVD